VNSECYTGWLDYWKGNHAHGDTDALLKTLEAARELGASINMYDRCCITDQEGIWYIFGKKNIICKLPKVAGVTKYHVNCNTVRIC